LVALKRALKTATSGLASGVHTILIRAEAIRLFC